MVQAARQWGRYFEERLDTKDIAEYHQRERVWNIQMRRKRLSDDFELQGFGPILADRC